jgi:hypothetical protein
MVGIDENRQPISISDLNDVSGDSDSNSSLAGLRTWFNTNCFSGNSTINAARTNNANIPAASYGLSDFWDTATFQVITRVQAETTHNYNAYSDGLIQAQASGVVANGVYQFQLAGGTITTNLAPNAWAPVWNGLNPTPTTGPGKNTSGTGSGVTTAYNLMVRWRNPSQANWTTWNQASIIIGEAGQNNCRFRPNRTTATGQLNYTWGNNSNISTANNSNNLTFNV